MNSILDYLETNAKKQPHNIAFEMLSEPQCSITYTQLLNQVNSRAAGLHKYCEPNDRVILLYPSCLEFIIAFLACLKASIIPVPVYPPNANRNRFIAQLNNLNLILKNTQPAFILTNKKIKKYLYAYNVKHRFNNLWPFHKTQTQPNLHIFSYSIKSLDQFKGNIKKVAPQKLGDVAFLQYTSGSTGDPKGVMITHANILDNTRKISTVLHSVKNMVAWLPLYHDMGLMNALFLPLMCAIPARILSPQHCLSSPLSWLEAISKFENCASGGPNFIYERCIKRIDPEQNKALDLSNWLVAYIGAEPTRAETIERFTKTFRNNGFTQEKFFPCYGLAESTVGVTGRHANGTKLLLYSLHVDSLLLREHIIQVHPEAKQHTQQLVSVGSWPTDDQIIVVDPITLETQPDKSVGEIWCQNKSIGKGYWRKPSATEHYFRAFTHDHQGPFLRTGDLGFTHEKQLYITGRIKDLILINGRNFAAEDIEWACKDALTHLQPGGICAFGHSDKLEEKLCIVIEAQPNAATFAEIFKIIRKRINTLFGLKTHAILIVKKRSLEKTSSGKLKRGACKKAFFQDTLLILAKQTANLQTQTYPSSSKQTKDTADQ